MLDGRDGPVAGVQAEQPVAAVGHDGDEQRVARRVPAEHDGLARSLDLEIPPLAGTHVPHGGPGDAGALVQHRQPRVAGDRRPRRRVQAEALAVPQVADDLAGRGVEDPERRVQAVAVLAVPDGDHRAVRRHTGLPRRRS